MACARSNRRLKTTGSALAFPTIDEGITDVVREAQAAGR